MTYHDFRIVLDIVLVCIVLAFAATMTAYHENGNDHGMAARQAIHWNLAIALLCVLLLLGLFWSKV